MISQGFEMAGNFDNRPPKLHSHVVSTTLLGGALRNNSHNPRGRDIYVEGISKPRRLLSTTPEISAFVSGPSPTFFVSVHPIFRSRDPDGRDGFKAASEASPTAG